MTFEWELSVGNVFVVLGVAAALFIFHRRAIRRLTRLEDLTQRMNVLLYSATTSCEEFKATIAQLKAELSHRGP